MMLIKIYIDILFYCSGNYLYRYHANVNYEFLFHLGLCETAFIITWIPKFVCENKQGYRYLIAICKVTIRPHCASVVNHDCIVECGRDGLCGSLQISGCVLTCRLAKYPIIQPPHFCPISFHCDCQSMFAQKYLHLLFSTLLAFIPGACVLFVCVFDKSV